MRRTCTILIVAAFAASLAGAADAAACRDAKGKFIKCPPPAPAASTVGKPASAIAGASSGPVCKKGKRCGNACISVKDTCHK